MPSYTERKKLDLLVKRTLNEILRRLTLKTLANG